VKKQLLERMSYEFINVLIQCTSWCLRCELLIKIERIIDTTGNRFEWWNNLPLEQLLPVNCCKKHMRLQVFNAIHSSTCQGSYSSCSSYTSTIRTSHSTLLLKSYISASDSLSSPSLNLYPLSVCLCVQMIQQA